MLIAYMKAVEIDEIYHYYLVTKIMNLIIKKLNNLDSVTVIREPTSNKELASKR